MQIRDFNEPMNSKRLNENLGKQFGFRLKLENFSDAQLEDARNKLRTRMSQFEVNESYDSVLESPDYQKTRMFLDVINQEIFEREMTSVEKAKEKSIKRRTDPSGMKKAMKKLYGDKTGKKIYFATIRKRAMDESVPESWIDSAISRIELGESDTDELKAELAIRYDINESKASWMLCEDEEAKAEIILSTTDIIDRVTGWLDDVANIRGEMFLELLDSIRSELGNEIAERYAQQVKPALDSIYTTIEKSRHDLTTGLDIVSGQEPSTMGSETGGDFGAGAGAGMPPAGGAGAGEIGGVGAMPPAGGAGGMAGAVPSPEEELPPVATDMGREKRESVNYSQRLASILMDSKKK